MVELYTKSADQEHMAQAAVVKLESLERARNAKRKTV